MDNFFDLDFLPDLDRVDAKEKVTGRAKYSAEFHFNNMAYGVMVNATIAKGSITSLDTRAAEKAPGVLAVLSHLNMPKLKSYEPAADADKLPEIRKGYKVFQDEKIRFNGQPIAIVVADTFERATYAASLVKAQYNREQHVTNFKEAVKTVKPLEGNRYREYSRGERDGWKNAPVKLELEYEIPLEVHNPMEMHALTVVWEGDSKVTVYEKTQGLASTQSNIAKTFGIPEANVRVICQYIGGAFGSAFNYWPHSQAAVIAGRMIQRPIRVSLTRDQMFTTVGYRPEAIQKIGIGATSDGKIVGITHEASASTASYAEFTEGVTNTTRSLYDVPNVTTRYAVFPMDLSQPTWMRGPGETTGMYALECAIDEMAYALKLDPLQFRLMNYAEIDPERNLPYSSKFLKEAYQMGAIAIGWENRNPEVKSMTEGEWQVGYGMGTGIFGAFLGNSKLNARLLADGTLIIQTGVTDMGPGTATSMTRIAAEAFGVAPEKIKFELGDSNFPPGPVQGGSATTATLGTNVSNAGTSMKKKLVELVKESSVFHTDKVHEPDLKDLVFENGYMILASDRSRRVSYSEALRNAGLPHIEILEDSKSTPLNKYVAYSYSVHFVRLRVHPATGVVKLDKIVTAVDAGRIVNEKTARSQVIGGVVGGIGMALMEGGEIDHRYGRWVNNDFANYHVPVHADVPHIEALFVNKPDPVLNPIGSKGMGEVTMVGFPAAVANAIFHATGKRIRQLPITPDKLI